MTAPFAPTIAPFVPTYTPARPIATVGAPPPSTSYAAPTAADLVTLTHYALGLWWAMGGPTWAAVASMVGDELDGRIARARGTASARGGLLDWGADISLTSLSLLRLGRVTGHEKHALYAAPPVLFAQAALRSDGYAPPVGSARAVIMIAAILAEKYNWKPFPQYAGKIT